MWYPYVLVISETLAVSFGVFWRVGRLGCRLHETPPLQLEIHRDTVEVQATKLEYALWIYKYIQWLTTFRSFWGWLYFEAWITFLGMGSPKRTTEQVPKQGGRISISIRHSLQIIWNANTMSMSCLKTSDTSLWLKHIKSWFSPICCHFAGHPSHFGQTQVRRPLVKLRGSGYADVQKLRIPQTIGFRIGNNQCVLDIIGWFWGTPNSGNLQL